MNGVDIRAVQILMGHKDIKVTMRYAHLSNAHLQGAVNVLDGLMKPPATQFTKNNTRTGVLGD